MPFLCHVEGISLFEQSFGEIVSFPRRQMSPRQIIDAVPPPAVKYVYSSIVVAGRMCFPILFNLLDRRSIERSAVQFPRKEKILYFFYNMKWKTAVGVWKSAQKSNHTHKLNQPLLSNQFDINIEPQIKIFSCSYSLITQ